MGRSCGEMSGAAARTGILKIKKREKYYKKEDIVCTQ